MKSFIEKVEECLMCDFLEICEVTYKNREEDRMGNCKIKKEFMRKEKKNEM